MKKNKFQAIQDQMGENLRSLYTWLTQSVTGKQVLRFILVPSIVVAFYLYTLQPDRYVSTASVLIKDTGVAQVETGLFDNLGIKASTASVDEQLLQSYIQSPDMLNKLDQEMDVKSHFSQSRDFIFGLSKGDPYEEFIAFYRKYVTVAPDADSGLLTITVQAYEPAFAQALARKILTASELFVNEASQAIAKREMQFALDEIKRSQSLLKAAKQALLEFQNRYNIVSPDSEGDSLFAIIFQLEGELAQTEAAIGQSKSYLNANAPQVSVLNSKANSLRKEIATQKERILGAAEKGEKLNELGARFQSLSLDLELATTLYTSALNAYEMSRLQAAKQIKHLVVSSKPQLPEQSLYPKRWYIWLTVFFILTIIFLIYRLILASIAEHND